MRVEGGCLLWLPLVDVERGFTAEFHGQST